MDRKKNIIYITGKDRYKIDEETHRFIQAFGLRQDASNIDTYRIDDIRDWWVIRQAVQTMGLFVEKRLFIFYGDMKKDTTKSEKSKTDKKSTEAEIELLALCKEITDDTFLIFSWVSMDTKSPLRGWLETHGDVRRYDTLWDHISWWTRYPLLNTQDIHYILKRYRESSDDTSEEGAISYSIAGSLEKLSLLRASRNLNQDDYDASLFIESEGKIFDLCDAILRGDAGRSLQIFHTLLEATNIHAFLASFIGLIRPSVYVKYLREMRKSQSEISSILWAHPYVIQKSYESRISYVSLQRFYDKILSLNIAYRSGKGRKDPELWRIFDIELAIMGLKK